MKYCNKKDIVEVFVFSEEMRWDNSDWPTWMHDAWQKSVSEIGCIFLSPDGCLKGEDLKVFLSTEYGNKIIEYGDYIVKKNDGSIYPYNPTVFNLYHEEI